MIKIEKVKNINTIINFMEPIWHKVYDSIVGIEQVNLMLEMYFSEKNLLKYLDDGLIYEDVFVNNNHIGIIGYYIYEDYVYLDKMYFKEEYRGMHLASYIFNYLEDIKDIIKLKANQENKYAIRCYLNNGFIITDSVVNEIKPGFVNYDYYFERNLKVLEQKTISYIKDIFKDDFSGHDIEHSIRVYNNAMRIIKDEIANKYLVMLASLLHDVDDIKLFKDSNHLEEYLLSINTESFIINKIKEIISQVSFKGTDTMVPNTIEGKIVQDADRLDALGAIGIARTFAYGGSRNRKMYDFNDLPKLNMNAEEYFNNKNNTINHFYEKLLLLKDLMNTTKGKELAIERHKFLESFLEQFISEVNGVK